AHLLRLSIIWYYPLPISHPFPTRRSSDLSFYYGDFRALEDLTLSIHENEITALIGPSGCGKSTFLRSLNRMNDTIASARASGDRSEEHTSELQSRENLVCRLLLEKKNTQC